MGGSNRAKAIKEPKVKAGQQIKTPESQTLQQVLIHDKQTFDNGFQCISNFIERNASIEMHKAIAIQVLSTAIVCWGSNILTAAKFASDVTGVSAYTVNKWAAEFYTSLVGMSADDIDNEIMATLLASEKGKACKNPWSPIHDEEFRIKAREFIYRKSYQRGSPNMTVKDFRDWIEEEYGTKVCVETARSYLQSLGFTQNSHHKAVYFDGHERDDVIEYRQHFLGKLDDLDRRCIYPGHTPQLNPGEKPLIQIHHDESTFYANADQSRYWDDGTLSVLKQKSLGQAIMVSDFIDEATSDYLQHDDKMARLLLETNSDGYFDSDKLISQVERAIDIFESRHPDAQALFLFDNAPSHKKCAEDALNADKMNVRPGGKQPLLRDTIFDGQVQKMVMDDGRAKGMKIVLEERGVETKGMNADKMREVLNTFQDFKNKKTLLEEKVESRGHLCVFFPKFHCELNAIERVWCHAKKYSRAHANGTITKLRKIVPESLDTCHTDLISKFFVTCRDYLKAYRDGCTCRDVDSRVKLYKSHRRVSIIT